MKDLENFIKENRADFDSSLPSENHLARFQDKLAGQHLIGMHRKLVFYKVAAAVLVLVAVSSVSVHFLSQSREPDHTSYAFQNTELNEAQIYYTSMINSGLEQIQSASFVNEKDKEMLLSELVQMDSVQKQLSEDMKLNPGDERVQAALIEHYRKKLSVISRILNQLELTNNSKTRKNEKVSL